MRRTLRFCRAAALAAALASTLPAATIQFTLLGDPNQTYTFARADSPAGSMVTDPAGPYPGYLGDPAPQNFFTFLCIDYLKTSTWNTSYSGSLYRVGDAVPNKSTEQLVEAAYLATELMWLGGPSANTNLYQGPISFAIWHIMDPVAGHVPVDPAAQPYIQDAQSAYQSGLISAASFPKVRIFIPDNPSIQGFLTAPADQLALQSVSTPEPGTAGIIIAGIALIGLGRIRRRRNQDRPV